MHPSGASGTEFEAGPVPAQFQVRTFQAMLRCRQGRLRIGSGCSTDGPLADCRLDPVWLSCISILENIRSLEACEA
eukprot:14882133-Alexandrium_andersonii.AAC.1